MIYRKSDRRDEPRERMRGGEGVVTLTELMMGELPPNVRLYKLITIPVGGSIGAHVHEGEAELFFFLSGQARVMDDGAPMDVAPGDVMQTPSGHSHSVTNIGAEPVQLLAVIVSG